MRVHFLDKPFWYRLALKTVRSLPPVATYGLARCIAGLVYLFSPRDRRNVSHNFELIFNGYTPPVNRKLLLWRFFQNYGIYVADFFRLLSMSLEESQAFAQLYQGRHHIDAALDRGRGAVLLTAHLGHWEIGGLGLRAMGYPVNVVALKHNTTFTNALINVMRMRHGIRIIEVEDSAYGAIELVKALNRNEVVAVLADRVFATDRAEVTTFFNRPVQLPVGPVLLAMAARAPIVPAFSIMEAPGRYRGIVEAPLELEYGPDRREALQQNLRRVATIFEQYIRRYPDQWYIVDPL